MSVESHRPDLPETTGKEKTLDYQEIKPLVKVSTQIFRNKVTFITQTILRILVRTVVNNNDVKRDGKRKGK